MLERRVKMADLAAQVREIEPEFSSLWGRLIGTGSFIGGEPVKDFEKAWATYTGASHAVGVANGTDALELILQGLGLPEDSTVLVPGNSFVATAEAVLNNGLRLQLVDVDESFGFNRNQLIDALTGDVSAVIAVHLYGIPQDLSWLLPELKGRGIHLIEDCAQAHGARIHGSHVGTFGTAGAFSFYPGKNLGALGDAGAIITSDSSLAERFKRISNHGRLGKFDHEIRGRNSRLDTLQAAALSLKLRKLDEWNRRRVANAMLYRELLGDVRGIALPPESAGDQVYHHFVIRTDRRDALRDYLLARGIESGIHYPESIDEMFPYQDFKTADLSLSRRLSREMVSLPVAEHITSDDVQLVSRVIAEFFQS